MSKNRKKLQLRRIMKLTTFMIIVGLMQASAAGFAQKVSLNVKNMPLELVLQAMKQQTKYQFVYTEDIMAKARPVNIHVQNAELKDVLSIVFNGQPLEFSVESKTIIIKEKEPSFLDNLVARFNGIDIRGKVIGENDKVLEGATVRVKGSGKTTKTNDRGEFYLSGVDENATLEILFLGYKTREVKAGKELGVIKMEVLAGELDEVKVEYSTGYQTISKERSTGSYAHIGNELLNRKVSTNVLDRITEVTSGLNFQPVVNTFGQGNITIRGISTINANKEPLIVIDNFPYDGNLNNINPNDISDVTVLKDAAAASIWGVRAGNGVIVITTKQGQFNKKLSVQINSNVAVGEKPDIYSASTASSKDMIDFQKALFASGYYDNYDVLFPTVGLFPTVPEAIELMLSRKRNEMTDTQLSQALATLEKSDVRGDIRRYFLQNSVNQQNALDLSGGYDNYKYYASVGYDNNKSNLVGNNYNRITTRLDNTFRPVSKLDLNSFIAFTQSKTKNNNPGLRLPNGGGISPYSRFVDENNNPQPIPFSQAFRNKYLDTASYPALLDWKYRPLDELSNADNTSKLADIRLGIGAKYNVTNALSAEVRYQYQRSNDLSNNYYSQQTFRTRDLINRYMQGTPSAPIYPIPLGGILDYSGTVLTNWNLRGQLNFNKQIGKHSINAITGTEIRETIVDANRNRQYGYNKDNSTVKTVDYVTLYTLRPDKSTRTVPFENGLSGRNNRYRSYYGNLGYAFQNQYSFNASGRIDGSNFYGVNANQKIVPLWSTGFGYEISNASFYHVAWLPYLKLRATYGFNGNTNNTTAAYTLISYGTSTFNGLPSATLYSPANPDLQWEKVKMINAGIDFTTKNGRLNGSIEFYKKRAQNLISPISTFPSSGVTSYTGNNASLRGNGIDITLNTINVSSRTLKWETNILFSTNQDKVTSYQVKPTLISDYVNNNNVPVVGQPLYKIYSYNWAGLDPANGAPRAYLEGVASTSAQVSSQAKISDLLYMGRITPSTFGSFRNSLEVKGVSLSINITYKFNYMFERTAVNYNNLISGWGGSGEYNQRWLKPGDEANTDVPALTFPLDPSKDNLYSNSSIFVEKADHIRLQDLRLGYNLDSKTSLFSKVKGQVYFYANNLGVIWKANKYNIDPDYTNMKPSKTFALGININF